MTLEKNFRGLSRNRKKINVSGPQCMRQAQNVKARARL